jgi:tetratricopeptide (TPR) repeat protein
LLSISYRKLNENEKAISLFQDILRPHPFLSNVRLCNGDTYWMENPLESIKYNMGVAYLALHNYGKAISLFQDVMTLNPNYPDIRNKLFLAKSLDSEK